MKPFRVKVKVLLLSLVALLQCCLARDCGLSHKTFNVIFNTTRNNFQITAIPTGIENVDYFRAKQCPCSRQYYDEYCPIANGENICTVHSSWIYKRNRKAYCYRKTRWQSFLRLIFMPSIILMAIAIVTTCTTRMGKNAVVYIFSTCCPCIRKRHLYRLIQQEMLAITTHIELENSVNRDDGKMEKTVLKLRTKTIGQNYQFTYEDEKCLICMVELKEGDRVGDMICDHDFHADCLTEWIKRRNACPLCNMQVADKEVLLVDKEEVMDVVDDNVEIDEEARSRFDRLTAHYRLHTSRRLRTQ